MPTTAIRWSRVAGLTALFSALAIALQLASMIPPRAIEAAEARENLEDVPFDIADVTSRRSWLWHQQFVDSLDLEPFSTACRDAREMYRAFLVPDSRDGAVPIIEVRPIGRDSMEVKRYLKDMSRGSGDTPPLLVSTRHIRSGDLASVHAALNNALAARIPAATPLEFADFPSTILETCRRGRYHYFSREWSADVIHVDVGQDGPDGWVDPTFVALAQSISQLARRM
jgi:hypothetical protein